MMLKKVARKADPYLVLSICLCTVIGVGSFLYYILADGGVFTLRDDFNSQQLPFSVALNHLLKNDLGEWSWNTDLGTQTVGAYSFYGLGSPFFWVSMLFPGSAFPYIVGYLYILKYVVAGATSYCYIKRFVKNPFFALIGALLYAFSGFQSTNLLFYHFHDAVAFFPLLLIGIEKALTENKKAWFIFAVFLNCMVNYFFFIGEVVFLLIYFVVRFWGRPSDMLKKAGICLFCGVLGVGMAAVLFIPSILFVLTNPRTNNSIHDILFSKKEILFIIKGILLPGEAMNNQSCVIDQHWNSTACYLPMTGISMVIAYLLRRRDWLAKILWTSLVFSFVPILSSAFTAFTTVYQRWWYMPILFVAIATAIVLENHREYPVKKGILINLIMLLLFVAVVGLAPKILGMGVLIFRPKVFIYNVLIAVVGLGILFFVFLSFKIKKKILCMSISLFCFYHNVFNHIFISSGFYHWFRVYE